MDIFTRLKLRELSNSNAEEFLTSMGFNVEDNKVDLYLRNGKSSITAKYKLYEDKLVIIYSHIMQWDTNLTLGNTFLEGTVRFRRCGSIGMEWNGKYRIAIQLREIDWDKILTAMNCEYDN